ncbi:hypothetical protein [Massilia sp. DD77]|uniref:hypothetical protein n=1 Tax=Massilia sp. DD77 TaxID=3109349 RepID=UPI002FFFF60F
MWSIPCAPRPRTERFGIGASNQSLFPLLATLAVPGALALCLRRLVPRKQTEDLAGRIARLGSEGLLLRQKFHAVRAFAVEELEDEGSHDYSPGECSPISQLVKVIAHQ